MIRRTAKILAWTAAGAVVAVGAAGGLFAWRLSQGPIALDPLTPYVERALSDPDGRYTVAVGSLVLSWVDEEEAVGLTRLDIRALDVHAVNADGAELAAVPEMGVGFSVRALLQGKLSPTRLDVVRPRLQVLRRADGSLDFDVRANTAPPESNRAESNRADPDKTEPDDGPDFAGEIVSTLLQPPTIDRPLGLLRRLSIVGADLTVVNRMLGLSWHASRADIVLARDGEEITGGARLALDLAGTSAAVEASGTYRMKDATTQATARFEGVEPASLAGIGPALAPLASVRVPIGGRLEATLDSRFEPVRVGFDLHGGAGAVSLPDLRPEPVRVQGAQLRGTLDIPGQRAVVDGLSVTLDELALSARGTLTEQGDRRTGAAHLELVREGQTAVLDLDGTQVVGKGATLAATLAGLEPARFAGLAPALAPLAAARVPLSGTAAAELDTDWRPRSGRAQLKAGTGRIEHPTLFPEPVTVASAALTVAGELAGDRKTGRLDVEALSLDLGGPAVDGTARATLTDGQIAAEGGVTAREVPVDALRHLWPMGLGKNAREWVTKNLSRGTVREATASFAAAGPLDQPSAIRRTQFGATIRGEDITVDYFHPLPVVTGAGVEATTDGKSFTIHTKGGRIDDVQVGDGTVVISGLDNDKEAMELHMPVRGPVRTILTVIDSPPLRYPSRLDLDPKRTQGMADAQLHMRFPLLVDLKVEDLSIDVTGKLRGVGIEKVAAGLNATDGDLSLALDMNALSVKGNTKLDGILVAIDWKEQFSSTAKGPRTRITVKGDVDANDLRSHGIDLAEHVEGPMGADILFTVDQRHRLALSANMNLEKTRLRIDELGWEKKPGVPGAGKLGLEFQKERPTRVTGLTIDAGGLRAQATLELAQPSMAVSRALVSQLSVGQTDLRAEVTIRPDKGGYAGTITGQSLDARALAGRGDKKDGDKKDKKPDPADGKAIPLDFNLRLNRVVFGEGRYLSDVSGQMKRDPRSWTALDINARTGGDGTVTVRYLPGAQGYYDVAITASNAGDAFRALDVNDRVQGGNLRITGRTVEPRADAIIDGNVELKDYALVDPPVLARILNAISPSGFAELMGGGKGIHFGRMAAEYRKEGRLLTLKDLRTSGSALGLTLEGEVDIETDTANLRGTIVPLYGLNRLIGQIPLLGDALSGGEGQGIFSATWRVQGPLSDPDVSVNPLAVLAPGFLRNLFFLGDGGRPAPADKGPPPGAHTR
ncbi:YhdP family protein [Azospirillum sp. sgz302134]